MTLTTYDARFLRGTGVTLDDTAPLTFTIEDYQILAAQLRQDLIASEDDRRAAERLLDSVSAAYERLAQECAAAHRARRSADGRYRTARECVWIAAAAAAALVIIDYAPLVAAWLGVTGW